MDHDHELFNGASGDLLGGTGVTNDFDLFGSSDYPIAEFHAINATASAQSSTNLQTVSPQDIFSDTMSAPPSGAYTNLSTPGTYSMESPYTQMVTSSDTSPNFDEFEVAGDSEKYSNLFEVDHSYLDNVASVRRVSANCEASVAPPMTRNQSSPGQSSSRGSNVGRPSSSYGVNPRKRDKPLPPITVEDPSDIIAVKRARNTAAARKSREKKVHKFEELEEIIKGLTNERDHWKDLALRRG